MWKSTLAMLLISGLPFIPLIGAAFQAPGDRAALRREYDAGNYLDAYTGFSALATAADTDPKLVGDDLQMAIECLRALGRIQEADALIEKSVDVHKGNWRLLWEAANLYQSIEHFGYLIGGQFERGQHRGGGEVVNSTRRDRVRALQLLTKAMELADQSSAGGEAADLYLSLADILLPAGDYRSAWVLQHLTDLEELPDYDRGWYYGPPAGGAPVDESGEPVFHQLPRTWAEATSDGQRWRWALSQAVEFQSSLAAQVDLRRADFLQGQFDVQTLAEYGWLPRLQELSDAAADKPGEPTGIFALHTLSEDETIARLATGVKRFHLPEEFNFIRIYQRIAASERGALGEQALTKLAHIFENRRQYPRAAEYWRQIVERYGPQDGKRERLEQIVGKWGRFEPVVSQPAGKGASVDFRFRNANQVRFEAHEIDVRLLLDDLKAYLKSNPRTLDWEKLQIDNLGYRLVQKNETKYLKNRVAQWDLALEPRPNHFDRLVTVTTPLQKAGAYLVTATVADGNVSKIVLWLNDTAIVKKPLDLGTMYYVADAAGGKPLEKINLELFGYRYEYDNGQQGRVVTKQKAEFTNADGLIQLPYQEADDQFQWLAIATNPDGRLGFLGYSHIWASQRYEELYDQVKVYTITDRPVYRPGQTMKFKIWAARATYQEPAAEMNVANRAFQVEIYNPRGDKVYDKPLTSDAYGGMSDEFPLADDAALGVYTVSVVNHGGSSFRVEEYKKPEYEVTVEAPQEPVALGEKITAKIVAKYYFGAPVTEAKVKYKITRTPHSERWYPIGPWDWLYGRGYGWLAVDAAWHPGWGRWGVSRPLGMWWPRPHFPPEIVAEREVEIGADGTVPVEIDTALAKELHPDQDHQYEISVEVTDASRRTIVGQGNVLVARQPFHVYAWVDRGFYRVGDAIRANFQARTLDGRGVSGKGQARLFKISYQDAQPVESPAGEWNLDTNADGQAELRLQATQAGQYRLSYSLTDADGHTMEGAQLFTIRGEGFNSADFRFDKLELVSERPEYQPGQTATLAIQADQIDATVLLFVRPSSGIYLPPKVIRMKGKSALEEIAVVHGDMPNFFVEAVTIFGGDVHTQVREMIVPPEKRVVDVEIKPSAGQYLPGQEAAVQIKVTDPHGQPVVGSTVVSIYDKSVEYIAGGSNVPEIREFFWNWKRGHYPQAEHNLARTSGNETLSKQPGMANLGIFGETVVDQSVLASARGGRKLTTRLGIERGEGIAFGMPAAPMAAAADSMAEGFAGGYGGAAAPGAGAPPLVLPTVRKEFADTALWVASVTTDDKGLATVKLKMPENLTTWKVKAWNMSDGTRVGQGETEIVTFKNLLVRLQAPRFFVQKDEVVLSANVHNYLKTAKRAQVKLELEGNTLTGMDGLVREVEIAADGEARVDWRVKVTREGEAVVRMSALTDEESDAMEMRFPVYVHGMLKQEALAGMIRPSENKSAFEIVVPNERRIEQSRLEIRYSPTLAGAMVDALPYMVDYPYGCTEQTLNRFLPTVVTQKILIDMGIDLAAVKEHRTNLNAQELGDPAVRAAGWKRFDRNPVFDADEVRKMVKDGVERLTNMQLSDGGWGWFSGWGEHSSPHTTALVVHGLQLAETNDVALVPGVLDRGVAWLVNYQNEQVTRIKNAPGKTVPYKELADNTDAFVFMVLVDAGKVNQEMLDFLYRDRTHLSVYTKAMLGLALHTVGDQGKLNMVLRNIRQFEVVDNENQTAYLRLPEGGHWWFWHGGDIEAMAYYLKLLVRVDPKNETAPKLVKYLLNNRKHATYWASTRDTSICIEALADYIKATGEVHPDMTVEVWLDGEKKQEATITADNLFQFDNTFVLEGEAVASGTRKVEIRKRGTGPVYYNAYLTNFTLEDPIASTGLEIKVQRKFYKLVPVEKQDQVPGGRGQVVSQRIEKFERRELDSLDALASGDLVEVELEIESKNDYEYLIFEDRKPAGFEPVEFQSGYNGNEMGAYVEFRDEKVAFLVTQLARGRHSVSYRARAEVPGTFSALPTIGYAMYAPELKANSNEWKVVIEDELPPEGLAAK